MSIKFSGGKKSNRGLKAAALVLAFVVTIGASIGGTLAWLTAQSAGVTNTFTSAELFDDPANDFTIWEHKATDTDGDGIYTTDGSQEVRENTYSILPGVNIPKDPTVDVVKLKEYAYLYIKVTGTLPSGVSYSIDSNNWAELGLAYPGVYVYKGTYADANIIKVPDNGTVSFTATILTDNQITVSSDYAGTSDNIKLSFEAYMVQATGNGDSAAEAWGNTYGKPSTPTT